MMKGHLQVGCRYLCVVNIAIPAGLSFAASGRLCPGTIWEWHLQEVMKRLQPQCSLDSRSWAH